MAEEPQEGERVVLGTRGSGMTPFHWSGNEPPGLSDLSGRKKWTPSGKTYELLIYDYPSFVGLLECYEKGEYLPDND